ncbi:carboxynorspermidine decarboxylase [Hyphomicrobium sp. CS1GBMeth3]|uniref:carboxynorspermidine decarboxylase n=1 Tax=Hyphomicrobium sp. CS1GBMeth3 TaxID=1892845 RepID=UPI000930645B|nr:carboxynorspermidine decarboxylase [Hyphomicrobium sp. CS1GBMeth3]
MTSKLPDDIRTPAYVLDVAALKRNLATATRVKREAGVKVLLATKAWAMPAAFPLMQDVLDGTTASGEYEARMGREEFGREVHVYAPAYAPGEVARLTEIADHIYANSPEQAVHVRDVVQGSGRAGIEIGARINPGYSNATLGGALYDPCAPNSRFGTTVAEIDRLPWDDIDIFHVHALCESLADGTVGLIEHVARNFAPYLKRVKAVNFGGGHFMNKPGYDVDKLIATLRAFRSEFDLEVYLEPGAGLVVDTGYLVSTVIGIHRNEKEIAILDASASTHMPDVLEVPYTPPVLDAEKPGVLPHSYILGGKTCMTGDIIGEYSFAEPLVPGSRVVFGDMMQYSFVKNTTFNGTPLPDIAMLHEDGRYEVVRTFGYDEFRRRLG